MGKIFDWFDDRGFLLILLMFAIATIVSLFRHWDIIPHDKLNFNIEGWLFITASILFVFSILIFAPIYRLFYIQKKRTIKKGKHYPEHMRFPYIFNVKNVLCISKEFVFTESCLYDFNDIDDYDRNKLFGVAFCLFPRIRHKKWLDGKIYHSIWFKFLNYIVFKPQHWHSVRFAWNTVNKENKIDIYAYEYHDGVRSNSTKIGTCDINNIYGFILTTNRNNKSCYLKFNDEKTIKFHNIDNMGFLFIYLGLYFGGSKPAPHNMTIMEY